MAGLETQLQLNLMGPPEVRLGEKSLKFPTRKTLALLVYLALEGGQQPRELLAALLWPESNQGRSYASLRNTLSHLQSALSEARELAQTSYLEVTHSALALNPDADIQLDLSMVEDAYALAPSGRAEPHKKIWTVCRYCRRQRPTTAAIFLRGFRWGMRLPSTIGWTCSAKSGGGGWA